MIDKSKYSSSVKNQNDIKALDPGYYNLKSDFGNNALIIRNEVTSSKTLFNKQLDKVRLNITNSSDNISEINTGVDKKYAGITYYSLEGKTLDFNITGKVNSKEKNNIKIEGIALAKGVQTTNVVIGYSILYVTNVDISTLINKATHCVYVPSVNGALVNFTNCNIRGYRYGVEILGGIENKYHMFLNCNIVADSGTAVQAQFYAEDKYSSYFNINVYDCSLTGNYGVYISISGISLRKTKVRIYVRNNTYNTTVANTGYSKGAFYPPQNPIIEE